jgi:hypothetical protein
MNASFWLALASLLVGGGGLTVAIMGYRSNRNAIGDAWAREWAAQRPVIYPMLTDEWLSGRKGGSSRLSACRLLPLKNGGRGPALNVVGTITVASGGKMREHRILASTVAAGDVLHARLDPPAAKAADWDSANGSVAYSDLAGGTYEQLFVITKGPGGEFELRLDELSQRPGSAALPLAPPDR